MSDFGETFLSGFPAKCIQECPKIGPVIASIQAMHLVSDALLQEGIAPISADEVPDELVVILGQLSGEELDPSNPEDRQRAHHRITGMAYEGVSNQIADQEKFARNVTNTCEGDGPLKARLSTDYGKMVVSICRADIAGIRCPRQHGIQANLRREE